MRLNKLLLLAALTGAISHHAFSEEKKAIEPTMADVPYDEYDLTKIDFWKAEGEGPRPLLVYIHGGGWIGGDKSKGVPNPEYYLGKGISIVAVNYRLNYMGFAASDKLRVRDAASGSTGNYGATRAND